MVRLNGLADPTHLRHNVDPVSRRFILLYTLAWSGGVIAYTPFLTILLPAKIMGLVPKEEAANWIASIAFVGAIAASLSNIAFGYVSDLIQNRRIFVASGLVLSCLLLLVFPYVDDFESILALIVCWQLALNLMLSPLGAWAGDCVPDAQKGTLGGAIAVAPAAGALSSIFVAAAKPLGGTVQMAILAALVGISILPLLFFGAGWRAVMGTEKLQPEDVGAERSQHIVVRMWAARLLVQVSEAALFAFLYYWFRTSDPTMDDRRIAMVFGVVLIAAIPVTLFIGRWVDRTGRAMLPLAVTAGISSMGLLAMSLATTNLSAMLSYALFGVASTAFLALHSAQTLRVLPRADRRGRDLGIFNLTNTVPSIVMPGLVLALLPTAGFAGLFILLSVMAAVASALIGSVADYRRVR